MKPYTQNDLAQLDLDRLLVRTHADGLRRRVDADVQNAAVCRLNRRAAVRRHIMAACILLILSFSSSTATARQVPLRNMNVSTPLQQIPMFSLSSHIVESL